MTENQIPASLAAQKMSYVTYTIPLALPNAHTVTTLEARSLLATGGTTGLRTWEAALHLGVFISRAEGTPYIQGKRVIELGAGTGFLSLLCAKHLGAEHVLSTDGSGKVVDDIVSNMFLNGLEGSVKMDAVVLVWGHALVGDFLEQCDSTQGFDLVLGSDIVSKPVDIEEMNIASGCL